MGGVPQGSTKVGNGLVCFYKWILLKVDERPIIDASTFKGLLNAKYKGRKSRKGRNQCNHEKVPLLSGRLIVPL